MSTPAKVQLVSTPTGQLDPHYACMKLRDELNQAHMLLLKAEYIIRARHTNLYVTDWEKELQEWKEKRDGNNKDAT